LMNTLASFAQYFEDKAPWRDEYKKHIEHSPIANVINVIVETGGTGPVSPIGVNLPNEQAIREKYGAKSILLHNVVEASDKSQGKDLLTEFAFDKEEIDNQELYGSRADNLHTAMHEVIGHGSGKASEKLGGKDPSTFLPGYYSTLEEARADLVAMWNAWDPKLIDIGIAKDTAEINRIAETMYQQAIRVAINQLRRIGKSDQLEEDHMKGRQLIASYIMQDKDAVEVVKRDGKTYFHITDYTKARAAVGKLLAELMRIKAEGDLPAVKALIDKFGLKVDTALRDEVQARVSKLDIASYAGFVQPRLEPVMDSAGAITDVKVSYPLDLAKQMLEYSAMTRGKR
ncbi:MAG TPA: peptidase M49, partial [Bacteroidota bacterium]|nr:peptidase M49 [Bacteroidota bacterium]